LTEGILNPYIAGAPVVEPSMFFGRQDVFDWIERSLSGKFVHHILVIHGQRRVGKTSVLKQIRNFLPSNYIQVFFDLQGRTNTSLDRFLWWLAREIARTLRQEHNLVVAVPDAAAFAEDSETLSARFLPNLRSQLDDRILLLTFDEFDTLEQPEIRETLATPLIEYLKRLFENEGLNFIFSIGSSGHKLENMQSAYTGFFKTALYRKISFLSREDCQQLITRPVQGVVDYESAAVDRIFSLTAGHPYFTQLMCHELFALCQKTGRRLITHDEVESIQEDVIERGTVNLKFVWDEANNLEKWVLALLANSGGGTKILELAQQLHQQRVRFSDSNLNGALLHLRDKDVIRDDHHFVVQLLQLWLQKNRPLERVREELVEVNPIANRYIEIGEEYRSLEKYEKALDSFQQALTVDPLNLKAQVSLAAVYLEQKAFTRASQAFEQALQVDSEDVMARGGFCNVFLILGDQALAQASFDEALRCYRRVLEVNAEHTEARQRAAGVLVNQAQAALNAGKDDEAISRLQEALQLTPEDSALQQQYAELQRQKLAKIIGSLREKASIEASAGHWNEAVATLQQGLSLAPEDAGLQQALAEIKAAYREQQLKILREKTAATFKAERWDECMSAWQEYLELDPEDSEAARQAIQQTEERKALSLTYQQAQAALEGKDFPRAVKLFKQVIYQDETYKDAARLLVQAIEAQNRRRRIWQDRRFWIGFGIVLAVAALVLASIALGPRLAAAIAQINATRTPTLPSGTATPTQLSWVTSFAEPILKEIQGHNPDFEDDFSTLKPEWGGDSTGEEVSPGVVIAPDYGVMGLINNQAEVQGDHLASPDFAIQYDFQVQPNDPQDIITRFSFRQQGNSFISFELNLYAASWSILTEKSEIQKGSLLGFDPTQIHTLLVIAQGVRFAIYLDGSPLAYFVDAQHPLGINVITAECSSSSEFKLMIHSMKFWKLAPAAPGDEWAYEFADPLINVAKRRTPDFSDDFSTPRSEWGDLPPGVKIENGVMSLFADNGEAAVDIPLWTEDFLLEFDVRAEKSGSNSQENFLNIAFRGPEKKRYIFFIFLGNVDGASGGYWGVQKEEGEVTTDIQIGEAAPIKFGDAIHLKLLAYRNQIGIILNDKPLAYFEDDTFQGVETNISAVIKEGECLVNIDNLNIWKLPQYSQEHLPTQEPVVSDLVDFPNPILKYIAVNPPNYKDDFSTHEAVWGYSPNVNWATQTTQLVLLPKLNSRAWVNLSLPQNFVMELDFGADLGLGTDQQMHVCFRTVPLGIGVICEGYDLWIDFGSKTLGIWGMSDAVELDASPLDPGGGNHLRIIAYGNQFTVDLNDQPVGNFYNTEYTGDMLLIYAETGQEQGKVMLGVLRYWDLNSITFLTTASLPQAVQQAIQRSPDFEDDFEIINPAWDGESQRNNFEFGDGLLHLPTNILIGNPSMNSEDFAFQTDLSFSEITENMYFMFGFRLTGYQNQGATEYNLTIKPQSQEWWLSVSKVPGAAYQTIQSGVLDPVEAGQWVPVMVVVYQDSFYLFWDQKLLLTYQGLELYGDTNHFGVYDGLSKFRLSLDNWKFWRLHPDWVEDFTQPILRTVASRPPDFDDDFSTPKSEIGDQWGEVFWSEQEGVFYLVDPGGQIAAVSIVQTQTTDFVYQFDFSSKDIAGAQDPYLQFSMREDEVVGAYGMRVLLNTGCWHVWKTEAAVPEAIVLADGCPAEFDSMGDHRLEVIALGHLFAYYLDDILIFYFDDQANPSGRTSVEVGAGNQGIAKVIIDNLKFWNLANYTLESMQLSNKIMDLVAQGQPDLKEDFNAPGDDWECDTPGNQCQLGKGVAQLVVDDGEIGFNGPYQSDRIRGDDFALRMFFSPRQVTESSSLVVMMRMGQVTPWDLYEFEYYPATGAYVFQYVSGHPDNRLVTVLRQGMMKPTPVDTSATLVIIARGKDFWAYFDEVLFFHWEDDQVLEGGQQIVLRSFKGQAHIDIQTLEYWNLDSLE
jgi:tetratricopeptide (TPR) repeat protein